LSRFRRKNCGCAWGVLCVRIERTLKRLMQWGPCGARPGLGSYPGINRIVSENSAYLRRQPCFATLDILLRRSPLQGKRNSQGLHHHGGGKKLGQKNPLYAQPRHEPYLTVVVEIRNETFVPIPLYPKAGLRNTYLRLAGLEKKKRGATRGRWKLS